MARSDKAAAVAELTEHFRSSNAAVLTEYRGLTVAQLKELRTALGETTTYAVVKNTLSKIAAKEAGVDAFDGLLQGPSAIAFVGGDPVEAAKGLREFARSHPLLVIKGGVLDGKPLTVPEISRLADLESREVLLGRLAGAFKGSLQGAVSLFAAPLAQAARVVDALRQKAEADPSVLGGGAGVPATTTAEPEPESAAAGTDAAPLAAAAEPTTDVAPAAEALPDADTAPAAEAGPDADTAPAAEAVPDTDVAPAAEAVPDTDVAPAAEAVPDADTAPAVPADQPTEDSVTAES